MQRQRDGILVISLQYSHKGEHFHFRFAFAQRLSVNKPSLKAVLRTGAITIVALVSLHTRSVWETKCDAKLDLVGENVVKIPQNRVILCCTTPTLPPSPQNWNFSWVMGLTLPRISPHPPGLELFMEDLETVNSTYLSSLSPFLNSPTIPNLRDFEIVMEDFVWWTGVWSLPLYPSRISFFLWCLRLYCIVCRWSGCVEGCCLWYLRLCWIYWRGRSWRSGYAATPKSAWRLSNEQVSILAFNILARDPFFVRVCEWFSFVGITCTVHSSCTFLKFCWIRWIQLRCVWNEMKYR